MDIWLAGLSNDPMDPFGADLVATPDRTVAYAWLIGSMIEWGDEAEPYILDVNKSLNDLTSAGVVVAWMNEDDGVETRGFVIQLPLMGALP